MADGSITFSTDLDNKQLEKELNSLTTKIINEQRKITKYQREKSPLVEQSRQIAANLDYARAKLIQMQQNKGSFSAEALQDQQTLVNG